MELGKTSYVILGMLRAGAKSGYEIKAKADVSTRFFWAISYGQIYPELKRLEKAGLIAGEADESTERRRRSYTLTAAGEQALHDWLVDDDDLVFELRHEGVLRLFFADALSPDERRELLHAIRAKHRRIKRELERIRPVAEQRATDGGDRFPLLTLETGIAYQDFFVDLYDRLEQELEDPTPATGGK
jgi:PadR family transcriptional regulator, regulatory protein AphA